MHGYERSNHNLTSITRTTQSIGTVIPIFTELALPGDTIKLNLGMNLNTRPAEAPLFGSFKVEMHVFKWDIRLGIAKMHMNQQGAGLDVGQIKFPQIAMEANNVDWSKPIEGQQMNSIFLPQVTTSSFSLAVDQLICNVNFQVYAVQNLDRSGLPY